MLNLGSPELISQLRFLNITDPECVCSIDQQSLITLYIELANKVLSVPEINWTLSQKIPDDIQDKQSFKAFCLCRKMGQKLNFSDFFLTDILDPDLRRTKQYLNEITKFAVFRQRQFSDHNQNQQRISQQQKEIEKEKNFITKIKGDINEERENTTVLVHNMGQKQDQLNSKRNSLHLLKQNLQCMVDTKDETIQKIKELELKIKSLNEQIFMLKEQCKMLQSKVISDPNEIINALQLSQQSMQRFSEQTNRKQKHTYLEEFKNRVFQRLNNKVMKVDKRLLEIFKLLETVKEKQKEAQNLLKYIGTTERNIRDSSNLNEKNREIINQKISIIKSSEEGMKKLTDQIKQEINQMKYDIEQLRENSFNLNFQQKKICEENVERKTQVTNIKMLDHINKLDEDLVSSSKQLEDMFKNHQMFVFEQINKMT